MLAAACTANIAGQKWVVGVTAPKQKVEEYIAHLNIKYILAISFVLLFVITGSGFVIYTITKWNVILQKEVEERKLAEGKSQQQKEFLNCIIESLPHPFYVVDVQSHKIVMANSATAPDGAWQGKTCFSLTHNRETPCDIKEHPCPLEKIKKSHKPVVLEHVHFDQEGHKFNVEVHGYPIFDNKSKLIQMIEYTENITERKKMEEQREQLISELKEALGKVKLLSGFLPICASCKMIRDDKGYWSQIESYIRDHSEAEFSHGICPDCIKKLYPEFYQKSLGK
jgi:PAS domain S-box-containing protein